MFDHTEAVLLKKWPDFLFPEVLNHHGLHILAMPVYDRLQGVGWIIP
jgi:hypothetical protein